jgi:hypothetical protein
LRPAARGELRGIIRAGPQELGVVAACFLTGSRQSPLQLGSTCDRRLRVRHRQDQGESPGQGCGCAAVPIFFVRRAGFAQVYVRVD